MTVISELHKLRLRSMQHVRPETFQMCMRVETSLVRQIDRLAADIGCNRTELARALLIDGVKRIESGEL